MDLYALSPEEFTAARDAAAKEDKSLKALRKPTVSAWVVNTLVRREPALLDQLLSLGADLGQAQQQGDAKALRELGEQRRQLVGAVTQTAVDLAGRDVTAAVRGEVEATLEAALADPASADAVRTGQLVRALSFAGFGGVDLEGAVADLPASQKRTSREVSAPGGSRAPREADKSGKDRSQKTKPAEEQGPSKRVQQLEAAALTAQGELDDAVRRAESAAEALAVREADLAKTSALEKAAAATVEEAKRALEAAQATAAEAQHRRTQAKKAKEEAERKAKRATTAIAEAQKKADAARKALDTARRS